MAIPTERVSGAIDVQLKALNSGGVMTEAYPITVVEDVIGVDQRIRDIIGSAGSIHYEVWSTAGTFPPDPAYNVIYLIPPAGTQPDKNEYDEYMWVSATGGTAHWEIIGNTTADVQNKMDKAGNFTNNHVLIVSGGAAIDGGKYLGSATFNGTSSNYMAREDGVVNYVSKRVVDATSSYKASKEAFGVVKVGENIAVSGGVISVPLAATVSSDLPGVVYATSDAALPEAADPTVPTGGAVKTYVSNALISAFGAQTLTGSAPIVVSGGTVSINAATSTTSGAVILSNAVANVTTAAITPAAVSTGLAAKVGVSGTFTANHVLLTKDTTGKIAIDGGRVVGSASFNPTAAAGSSTLATEAGVSAYVASASPKAGLAGYTSASSGLMYVVSSGGALTITSGGLNVNLAGYADGTDSPAFGVIAVDASEYHGLSVTNGILSIDMAADTALGVVYAVEYDDPYGFGAGGAIPGPCVPTAAAVEQYVGAVVRYGADGVPLYIAETANYGVVKIGDYINVNDSGVISVSSAVVNGPAGVVKLVGTVGNVTSAAITPAGVSSYVSSLAAGISAIAPLNDNITATGGTISISSATATQSGAVLIMSGGTFTNAANKVATEGAVFSNCIFYSIV